MKKNEKGFIVGDSMIKNITGTGISRTNNANMRPYPEATSVTLCGYIIPDLIHKPDVITIHCRTNDIK